MRNIGINLASLASHETAPTFRDSCTAYHWEQKTNELTYPLPGITKRPGYIVPKKIPPLNQERDFVFAES